MSSVFDTDEYKNCGPVARAMVEYCTGFLQGMDLKGTIYEVLLEVPRLETAAYLQGQRDGVKYYNIMKGAISQFPDFDNPDNRRMFAVVMAERWAMKPAFYSSTDDILALMKRLSEEILAPNERDDPFSRMFGSVLQSDKPATSSKSEMEFSADQLDLYLKNLLDGGNA